jgi:hypothetical protein
MVYQQKLHDCLPGFDDLRALCLNDHTIAHLGRTGNDEFGELFDFDKTHPTIPGDGEFWMPAEMRYLDAVISGSFNNRLPVTHLELSSV